MKKIKILLLIFLLPFLGFSQTNKNDIIPLQVPSFEFDSQEILFREIFEFDATQKEIHSSCLKAVSELYRSSKSVIDLNDSEGGELIVKGNLPMVIDGFFVFLGGIKPIQITYTMEHSLIMESKDGRLRISISRFKFLDGSSDDGQYLVFNPPNNLDENYVKNFELESQNQKLKKNQIANLYNQSLILNEINRISDSIINQIQQIVKEELEDDW